MRSLVPVLVSDPKHVYNLPIMENGGISSLITNLRLCVLLLVVAWCLQKDANVFLTKRNVSRNSDLKNIPVEVTNFRTDL